MLKRKMLSIITAGILMFTGIATTTSEVEAAPDVKVKVDGNYVNFPDAKPFIDSASRTLIPLRFVSEALGAQVDWNAEVRAAGVRKGEQRLILYIGSKEIIKEDNTKLQMDTSAQIYQGRTYVPLRFVSEALGAKVGWEASTYTVVITTDGSEPQISTKPADSSQSETMQITKNGKTYTVLKDHPMVTVGVRRFDEPTFLVLQGDGACDYTAKGINVYNYSKINQLAPGFLQKEYTKEEVRELNKKGVFSPKQLAWYLSETNTGIGPDDRPDHKKTLKFSESLDYSKNEDADVILKHKEVWEGKNTGYKYLIGTARLDGDFLRMQRSKQHNTPVFMLPLE